MISSTSCDFEHIVKRIHVDENLTWNHHVKAAKNKANKLASSKNVQSELLKMQKQIHILILFFLSTKSLS